MQQQGLRLSLVIQSLLLLAIPSQGLLQAAGLTTHRAQAVILTKLLRKEVTAAIKLLQPEAQVL